MKIGLKMFCPEKRTVLRKGRRGERGYALVAMIGVMLFALILTTATAPTVKYEMQREKEEEMLFRGQQVADALGKYRNFRNGQYPTDLKEMVEGVTVGVNKMRLLRPSALCDPMVPCDPGSVNWKLVHQGDSLIRELYEAYTSLQQSGQVALPPPPQDFMRQAQLAGVQLPGQEADTKLDGNAMSSTSDSNSDSSLTKLPILGVVSRKSGTMFRNYYGIELYDHSLFFAGLAVVASGFNPAARLPAGGLGLQNGAAPSPTPMGGMGGQTSCGRNQVLINGQCYGIFPGNQCRGPDGTTIPCPK